MGLFCSRGGGRIGGGELQSWGGDLTVGERLRGNGTELYLFIKQGLYIRITTILKAISGIFRG